MSSEKSIMNDMLIDVTALPDTMAYRQNTGLAWQGQEVDIEPGNYIKVERGMKILRDARPVRFGVPGGGDIIGVRKGTGFQIEAKTLIGYQAEQQRKFGKAWEKAGGVYILARSRVDAVNTLLTRIP